jgi:hypothetical protein
MADSFLLNKEALVLFDSEHKNPGEAYKNNKLSFADWDVIEQAVSVIVGCCVCYMVRYVVL